MDKIWSILGRFLSLVCFIYICSFFSVVKADVSPLVPNLLINVTNSAALSEAPMVSPSAIPLDENGDVQVNDLPVNTEAASINNSENNSESAVSDLEFDDLPDAEGPAEELNEEVLTESFDSELQDSPLRQYDIKAQMQDSPLHQYDIKSDLQTSPLRKYEMKFTGKEANTAAEQVEEFKKYPEEGIAPQFKNIGWQAPYNKKQ